MEKAKTYYTKINTCFKRDMDKASKTYNCIIPDQLTTPEFELFREMNIKWECTEKIDGECTSIHLIPKDGDYVVEVHGKTSNAQMRVDEVELLQGLGTKENLLKAFSQVAEDGTVKTPDVECIIFGETYGKKMQKAGSRYCADKLKFICFDVKVGETWLKREAVVEICEKAGIDVVPYFGYMTLDEAIQYVDAGFKSVVSEDRTLEAEGLVLRAPLGLLDRMGRRIITKIKTKDFRDLEAKLK